MRRAAVVLTVALFLTLPLSPAPAPAAAPVCAIVEGAAIGPVRIGMPVAQALRATGKPIGEIARRNETTYLFKGIVTQLTAVRERVERLATQHQSCITSRGVRVGDVEGKIQAAYARALGSLRGRAAGLVRLVFPFNGVGFVLAGGKVTTIEVFRPEAPPVSLQVTPSPGASPAEGVEIASLSGRAEGGAFVVTGSVRNAGRPLGLFVEIVLLGTEGQPVGGGSTTVHPSPIGGGRVGTFEERISADNIVAQFIVTVRASSQPTVALARARQEVKDVAQFGATVERLIEVSVLGATLERGSGTVAAVTNRSPLLVTGLVIEVQMRTTCRVQQILPTPPVGGVQPPPAGLPPGVRVVVDQRQGTIRVASLPPNARVEVPIELEDRGPCTGFGGEWVVTWRVVSIKVEPPPKS